MSAAPCVVHRQFGLSVCKDNLACLFETAVLACLFAKTIWPVYLHRHFGLSVCKDSICAYRSNHFSAVQRLRSAAPWKHPLLELVPRKGCCSHCPASALSPAISLFTSKQPIWTPVTARSQIFPSSPGCCPGLYNRPRHRTG